MTFPSLPMNIGICIPHTAYHVYRMPCLTSWEFTLKGSLSLSTHKCQRCCASALTLKTCPFSCTYFDGVLLPYTDSFKYSGMVCDKQINLNTAADAALRPFTAGTFRVKEFVQKHKYANTRKYDFSRRTRVRFRPLLPFNKAKRWTVPYRSGCCRECWKGCWGSETPRLHGVSCASVDWNPSVQLVLRGNAAVQFLD